MYALTFCYEACDGNEPYACTIAVSEDKDKLIAEMKKCVDEDTQIDEDDEWDEDCNYHIFKKYDDTDVYLQHNARTDLYTHYSISEVEVL